MKSGRFQLPSPLAVVVKKKYIYIYLGQEIDITLFLKLDAGFYKEGALFSHIDIFVKPNHILPNEPHVVLWWSFPLGSSPVSHLSMWVYLLPSTKTDLSEREF